MAKCPGCQKVTSFAVEKQALGGTGFMYNIVVCSLCHTAIGLTGTYNTDAQILELREAIRAIAAKANVPVKLSKD
jgi:recombinational DNA repair protein (RecF pathway)